MGDAKLTAAIGAWVGVMQVPVLIAGAAGLALLFALCQWCCGREVRQRHLPFGPFLALVGAGLLMGLPYLQNLFV